MLIEKLIEKLDEIQQEYGNIEVEVAPKYSDYTGNMVSGIHVEDDVYSPFAIAVIEIE